MLINSTAKDLRMNVDERPYPIKAGAHATLKHLKPGIHYVKQGHTQLQTITTPPNRTTVIDLGGDGCYAVIDYTPQYNDTKAAPSAPTIIIEERFKKQPLFTTRNPMTVAYQKPLPPKIDIGRQVRRLMPLDCSIIEVDSAIIEAVARQN